MAYANTHAPSLNVFQFLARPFIAFDNAMSLFAGAVVASHEADRIAEMSDAELDAKGLTRAEAIQNLFAEKS